MDNYFPPGYSDIDNDAMADEVFDLACINNNTKHPTDAMLQEAEDELTASWERYENYE